MTEYRKEVYQMKKNVYGAYYYYFTMEQYSKA